MTPSSDDAFPADRRAAPDQPGARPGPAPASGAQRAQPQQDPSSALVEEIRGTLADLAQRALAAQRRERDLERCFRQIREQAYQAARQELEELRQRLEARSRELDARARELAARGARLAQLQGSLPARQQEQQQALRELRQREPAQRGEQDRLRRSLLHRVSVIRQREAEAARRLAAARDELQQQRAELAGQAEALRRQATELADRTRALEAAQRQYAAQAADPRTSTVPGPLRALRLPEQRGDRPAAREPGRQPVPRTGEPPGAAHRGWRVRSCLLAATAAAAAAGAWLARDRPQFRARARLLISSRQDAPRAAARHVARILGTDWSQGALGDRSLARAWRSGRVAGRCGAAAVVGEPAVELLVSAADADAAGRLARRAAAAYRDYVNAATPEPAAPAFWADLQARRASVAQELAALGQRRQAADDALRKLPVAARREALVAEIDRLRSDYRRASRTLETRRRELAEARRAGPPPATVLPETCARALAADPSYQQDLKELRAAALKYRSELALAMVLLADPLAALRQALATLSATLSEQQELKPPAQILAVLERCRADVGAFDEQLAAFAQQWAGYRQRVERWKVEQPVAPLVTQQNAAADAARRAAAQAGALVKELRARVASLSDESSAQTRGIVVAAVLRAETERLSEKASAFAKAAETTDVTANFRLEAHDRQLRGIQTRLQQRRQTIRSQVEQAARRRAAAAHDARLTALADAAARSDQQREHLLLTLAEKLEQLQGLDRRLGQRQRLETELELTTAAIGRLSQQLGRLDQAIARARRARPRPDRIEQAIALHTEQTAGRHRYRNAALAGSGAFAAAWLISALTVFRKPLRRTARPADERPADAPGDEADVASDSPDA